jgi:hypothetical protein
VFKWDPFRRQCTIFIILSMGPNECPSSIRCFAKLDMLLLLQNAVMCSLYCVWNHLPVCPTYVLWQSGQVNLYNPDKENLSREWWSLWVSKLPKLWVVQKAILSPVRLKMFVMYVVSLPV